MINISKEEIRDKMFFVREEDSDQPIAVIKVADLLEKEVEAYPFEQVQELVKLNQQFAQEIENLKRPQGDLISRSEAEKLGATCLAKREVATERPQTIGCFNCKYDTKMLCEEPCKFCNFLYSEWRQKE